MVKSARRAKRGRTIKRTPKAAGKKGAIRKIVAKPNFSSKRNKKFKKSAPGQQKKFKRFFKNKFKPILAAEMITPPADEQLWDLIKRGRNRGFITEVEM